MEQEYEYVMVEAYESQWRAERDMHMPSQQQMIKQYSEKGWRLVAVACQEHHFFLYFERPFNKE